MPISADARRSSLAPYLACLVVLVAMLPLQDSLRVGEVAIAIAMQALVGLGLVFGHRLRRDDALPVIAGILIFVASVALLRDGAGTGYGPLMSCPPSGRRCAGAASSSRWRSSPVHSRSPFRC